LSDFADRLLAWWQSHGRRDLPWQQPREPYRVWVSEIMLQQTRVETVVGYFDRFLQRFPDLETLADADLDDVLALWSGLGYYARARNLHAAAIRIRDEFDGRLPEDEEILSRLPGIGRSTAAAIVAQGFDRRAVILDGNVKRVLARHAGVTGWPGAPAVEKQLWHEAEMRTPAGGAADYTQAIMDLGAMVCKPAAPDCAQCPLSEDCRAFLHHRQDELPTPGPKRKLPERRAIFQIARDEQNRVLLRRRPPAGIWGGLWCLPEAGELSIAWCESLPAPRAIRHVFTHFALTMNFEHGRIQAPDAAIADDPDLRWFDIATALQSGLPRPIHRLLTDLRQA